MAHTRNEQEELHRKERVQAGKMTGYKYERADLEPTSWNDTFTLSYIVTHSSFNNIWTEWDNTIVNKLVRLYSSKFAFVIVNVILSSRKFLSLQIFGNPFPSQHIT